MTGAVKGKLCDMNVPHRKKRELQTPSQVFFGQPAGVQSKVSSDTLGCFWNKNICLKKIPKDSVIIAQLVSEARLLWSPAHATQKVRVGVHNLL
jgi:hypothetical protein